MQSSSVRLHRAKMAVWLLPIAWYSKAQLTRRLDGYGKADCKTCRSVGQILTDIG